MTRSSGGYLARPAPSGLADVIDLVLDKGVVIDAYVRVSLLGIELLTIDARVVVASVDTYLRFAEATNRLDLAEQGGKSLPDMATEGSGKVVEHVASNVVEGKVEGVIDSVKDKVDDVVGASERAVEKVTGSDDD
jgi:gas vesicle structural protein